MNPIHRGETDVMIHKLHIFNTLLIFNMTIFNLRKFDVSFKLFLSCKFILPYIQFRGCLTLFNVLLLSLTV